MGRRKCAVVGVALVLAVLLGGCGSDTTVSPTTPTTRTDVATSRSLESSPAESTPLSSAPVSTSEATATSSNPWPDDFTPEQVAASQAAIEAFTNSVRVYNEARQNPVAQDWSLEIRQYTMPPRSDTIINEIVMFAQNGVQAVGDIKYGSPTVTVVTGNSVTLTACRDSSGTDIVNSSGDSVLASAVRPPYLAKISLSTSESVWKLASESVKDRVPC